MIVVTRALSAELTSGRARAAAGCLLRRGRRTTSRCVGRHACRAFMEAEHPRRPTGTTRLPGRACAKHDLCIADHDVICSYLFLLVSCSIIETCKRFTADQRSLSPYSRVSFAPPAITASSCCDSGAHPVRTRERGEWRDSPNSPASGRLAHRHQAPQPTSSPQRPGKVTGVLWDNQTQ